MGALTGNDIGLGGNALLLDSGRWPLRGVGPQHCPEQEAEAHRVEEPQGAQSYEIGLSSRFSKANDSSSFESCGMFFRNANLGSVYQVRETLYVGLPHIRPDQVHKFAMTYDFDQSTVVQFVCMMRECSRGNLVFPEKASQRYRVPVSGYLPQHSNSSRLGEGARDSSKLMICQMLIILCQNKALTLCGGQQFSGLLDSSHWHASSSLSLLRQLGTSGVSRTAQRVCLVP